MVCDECSRKIKSLATVDDNNKRVYGKVKIEIKKYSNIKYFNLKCLSCTGRVENNNKYCITCAYKKGICEVCGKQLTNTKMYKYNDVDEKDLKRRKKTMERSRIISEEIKKEKGIIEPKKEKVKIIKKDKHIKENKKEIKANESIIKEKKPYIPLFTEEDKKDIDSSNEPQINFDEYDEVINL